MDADFWLDRWRKNEIGFHLDAPNPALVNYFPAVVRPPATVFLPLCGKTRDIHWLLGQGYAVIGAELSALAIDALFAELGVASEDETLEATKGPLVRRTAANLTIFVGDILALDAAMLGPVDAVYDRAALVALPPTMRTRYVPHLVALSRAAPQLLVTFEYDQTMADGPPFSVGARDVQALYGETYATEIIAHGPVPGGLHGGQLPATETVWRLTPR